MKQSRTFEHSPQSVAAARRFATETLRGMPKDVVEAAELMVSELATNCVRHTESGFLLTIDNVGGEVRIEATDAGRGEPTMRSPRVTDPTGRGLQIIDMLATTWGVLQRSGSGKTVWFTIAPTGPTEAVTAQR